MIKLLLMKLKRLNDKLTSETVKMQTVIADLERKNAELLNLSQHQAMECSRLSNAMNIKVPIQIVNYSIDELVMDEISFSHDRYSMRLPGTISPFKINCELIVDPDSYSTMQKIIHDPGLYLTIGG